MARLFFLLSGEHSTLPFSELKAILEAEEYDYKILGTLRQVAQVEANVESIRSIVGRSALTRVCCIELISTEAVPSEIFEKIRLASIEKWIQKGKTFVVRVRRVGESAPEMDGTELERKIGAIILDKINGLKVKLVNPNLTFFGVLTEKKFVFGLKLADINPRPFVDRRPRKRPFFHPSAMQAKLARCMVNLAQPKARDVILDPFCGTAGLLIEAGLIGCKVIGLDVQRRMIRGSLLNLRYYGVKPEGIIRADALCLPVNGVDCIVTDPPYGRSAAAFGRKIGEIVKDFLSTAVTYIPRGKRICLASPESVEIGKLGEELGFKHVESHSVYVHRSLTREIAVMERI